MFLSKADHYSNLVKDTAKLSLHRGGGNGPELLAKLKEMRSLEATMDPEDVAVLRRQALIQVRSETEHMNRIFESKGKGAKFNRLPPAEELEAEAPPRLGLGSERGFEREPVEEELMAEAPPCSEL